MTVATPPTDRQVRDAAWVARYVGRGELSPLGTRDVVRLAEKLSPRPFEAGDVVFEQGDPSAGVCIVRRGLIELVVGRDDAATVVEVLRAGDIEGDVRTFLDMPSPYEARALRRTECLMLDHAAFDELLQSSPALCRRWLSSVAMRLARSQARILELLGRSLTEQVCRLLLDESVGDVLPLPQRTIAAMLGARRPSVNRVLRELGDRNVIRTGYGEITILDRGALTALCGDLTGQ